ncbi:hypothetical protein FOZ62_016535, partial [Perkinsus olseni]
SRHRAHHSIYRCFHQMDHTRAPRKPSRHSSWTLTLMFYELPSKRSALRALRYPRRRLLRYLMKYPFTRILLTRIMTRVLQQVDHVCVWTK